MEKGLKLFKVLHYNKCRCHSTGEDSLGLKLDEEGFQETSTFDIKTFCQSVPVWIGLIIEPFSVFALETVCMYECTTV